MGFLTLPEPPQDCPAAGCGSQNEYWYAVGRNTGPSPSPITPGGMGLSTANPNGNGAGKAMAGSSVGIPIGWAAPLNAGIGPHHAPVSVNVGLASVGMPTSRSAVHTLAETCPAGELHTGLAV